MERGPEMRIVGDASEEEKEQVKKEVEQALFNHLESLPPDEREIFEKFEYPKSEKEIALINFANEETSRLMQEAGVEPYNVPTDCFHIMPPEAFKEIASDDASAITLSIKREMIFDAQHFRANPVNFGALALHELMHLKAYFSLEVSKFDNDVKTTPYREGIGIRALQRYGLHGKYHEHFTGLHEAIVSEIEKRSLGKLLDRPELATEKKWLASEEAQKMKEDLAEKEEIPVGDIIWVGKKGDDDWELVQYLEQRDVLNYVCVEIQQQFPEQYQSPEDVFKTFLNAHFTGKLLPLARAVEKTFGEGSFRQLGNMGTDSESGILHLESLKKARMRQVRAGS